jgi:hypothetical protein
VIALASYQISEEDWVLPPASSSAWLINEPRILQFPKKRASSPLADLLAEIDRSREILSWQDDWDDEGSPHFEEATWKRATEFLERHARLLLKKHGLLMPTPRILPGPNGSIDLHWETGRRELLMNIRPDSKLAGFYGEASGTSSLKGKADLDASDLGLFTWLTVTD